MPGITRLTRLYSDSPVQRHADAIMDGAPLRHRYDALTPVDMAAYRRRCAEIRTLDERADRAREV